MKLGFPAVALILGLGLGLAAPALAQEDPKKEEPAKEEPAKEEPAKEEAAAPAEAKPAAEAAPAAAAKPAAEAAATPKAEPAAAPELSGCAKSFSPLADTYKSAYDDLQKWIAQINTETGAAGAKVQQLQTQIQENEAAVTQAKLAKDDSKTKSLQKEGKKLWDDFNAAKKDQSAACSKFVKEAPQRVKQYSDATSKSLDALKSQSK